MKGFIIVFVFTLTACAQIAQLRVPDPAETKAKVTALVDAQRKKKDWMAMDSCPFDRMPETGRRPTIVPDFCAKSPEKCLEKCEAKDADACYFLANLIQDHDKIESDVAEVLYQRSCELGITSGCTNRAANILERKNNESDKCAARTFEKACSQDDPWACTMFGFVLSVGIGREKDVNEAEKKLKKACEIAVDKNGGACKRANELIEIIEKTKGSE